MSLRLPLLFYFSSFSSLSYLSIDFGLGYCVVGLPFYLCFSRLPLDSFSWSLDWRCYAFYMYSTYTMSQPSNKIKLEKGIEAGTVRGVRSTHGRTNTWMRRTNRDQNHISVLRWDEMRWDETRRQQYSTVQFSIVQRGNSTVQYSTAHCCTSQCGTDASRNRLVVWLSDCIPQRLTLSCRLFVEIFTFTFFLFRHPLFHVSLLYLVCFLTRWDVVSCTVMSCHVVSPFVAFSYLTFPSLPRTGKERTRQQTPCHDNSIKLKRF